MKNQYSKGTAIAGGIALASIAAGAVALARQLSRHGNRDDAPGRTARHGKFGDYDVVGRSVTIDRPREELFAYWRDFQNLSHFMENVESIQMTGRDRSVWTISAPAGQTVALETDIVEERDGELIAWRSTGTSQIKCEGRVAFRAGGKRGTIVEAIIAYDPPAGEAGRLIAKLFQKEPAIQARRELKRFKMLMETGEIATSDNRAAA